MVDWMREADRGERRFERGRVGSPRGLRPTGDEHVPHGPAGIDGSRPLSGRDVAALQPQVGNAAVCQLLAVQRDGLDDEWTTGGSPPANQGAGWSTGGPPPGGAGPVEEPGYGPPGEEPEEPAADEDVELSRWLSYSGSAIAVGSKWIIIASRRRSGDEPGFDTIKMNGKAGEYGLPEPKKHPDVGGYAATVRVWSTSEPGALSPTNGLIQVHIGAAFAPGSGAQLALAQAAQGGGDGAGGGGGTSRPLLIRGSVGPAVKDLQARLGVDIDGIFGPGTERAVRQFQADNGLDADGIVGPKTNAALDFAATIPATGGA